MPNIHDGWSTVTCTRVPEDNILLLKWLPNQRTIYSIVYKLDFQFIVIMATYICTVFWKEIYSVCINQMSIHVYVFVRIFQTSHIDNSNTDTNLKIKWIRCDWMNEMCSEPVSPNREYSTTKNRYDYQSLFILLYCCTLIRFVLFL